MIVLERKLSLLKFDSKSCAKTELNIVTINVVVQMSVLHIEKLKFNIRRRYQYIKAQKRVSVLGQELSVFIYYIYSNFIYVK